jgi:hypothetical protein
MPPGIAIEKGRAMKTEVYFQPNLSPCASCPYRADVDLMYWVREEYERLLASTRATIGIVFGCHKYRRRPKSEHVVCAGWLLDQREQGCPSIALRLAMTEAPDVVNRAIETVHDGGHECGSTEEICKRNLAAFDIVERGHETASVSYPSSRGTGGVRGRRRCRVGAMRRPALTRKVVRGLGEIVPFVSGEIEAGNEGYLQNEPGTVREDAATALSYLYALIEWYEKKHSADGRK